MSYDSANASVRRELTQAGIAGAASATMRKFAFFQKTKLKKVHLLVETAGTNVAAGVDILVGTNSVGAIVIGTDAANTFLSSAALDVDVPAGSFVELKGKANSATAVVCAVLEHEVAADAVQS
jgi:hypothetical protein